MDNPTKAQALNKLTRAHAAKLAAHQDYLRAIDQARRAGCTFAEIGLELGITKQRAFQLASEAKPKPNLDELTARILSIEKRHDALISRIADQYRTSSDQTEQLRRNKINGTLANKKPGSKGYHAAARIGRLSTVAESRELAAAFELGKFCEDHPTEPLVLRFLAERRELLTLRDQVEEITRPEWFS